MGNERVEINGGSSITSQFMKPATVLFLWLGLVPLFDAGFDHEIVYWLLMVSAVLLVGYLMQCRPWISFRNSTPVFYLISFVLWSGISVLWSIHPTRSLVEFLQLCSYGLVFCLVLSLDEEAVYRVGRIALIAGTGVAAYGIMDNVLVSGNRMQSTFTNANPLGIYLTMILLLILGVNMRMKNKGLMIIGCLIAVAWIMTGSRGSYLVFMLSLPVVFIGRQKKDLLRDALQIVFLLAASFILANFLIFITPYVQGTTDSHGLLDYMIRSRSSVTGRLEFWKVAVRLIKYHPLKGFGIGTFFSAYMIEYSGNEWFSRFVHNEYLQVLVETGIVGFLLLLFFLFSSFFFIAKRMHRRDVPYYYQAVAASCLAFLMHIFIDFTWNFPAVSILFFSMLALVLKESPSKNNCETVASLGMEADSIKETSLCKEGTNLSYKLPVIALTILFVLTLWLYSSLEILKRGGELEASGDTEEAFKYYQFSNHYFPFNNRGYMLESQIYIARYSSANDFEALEMARKSAEKALDLTPYDASTLNFIGKIYWIQGDMEQAESYLQKATSYSGYAVYTYLDLANFYYGQNEFVIAETVLKKADTLNEYAILNAPTAEKMKAMLRAASIHHLLATIYEGQGKSDLEEEQLNKEQEYLKQIDEFQKLLQ